MTSTTTRSQVPAALCLLVAVFAGTGTASANRLFMSEMIAASNVQRTLVRTMGVEIMRSGLRIDEQSSLDRLREAHFRFGRSLAAMQQGNDDLEDSNNEAAQAIIGAVRAAAAQWRSFDGALQPVLAAGTITATQARELFDLNRQLGDAVERVHGQYHQSANHYGVVTVMGRAILVTEQERALGQRITSEFLSIAMGADPSQHIALIDTAAQFERLMRGLAYGDPEFGLVQAPTPDLRQQWSLIESLWGQMIPHIAAATTGEPLSRDQIDSFAELSARLHAAIGQAGEMLVALVPPGRR